MKAPLKVLIVLGVVTLTVGYCRGWFAVTSHHETAPDRVNINLKVDTEKFKADAEMVKEKTTEIKAKVTNKSDSHPDASSEPADRPN